MKHRHFDLKLQKIARHLGSGESPRESPSPHPPGAGVGFNHPDPRRGANQIPAFPFPRQSVSSIPVSPDPPFPQFAFLPSGPDPPIPAIRARAFRSSHQGLNLAAITGRPLHSLNHGLSLPFIPSGSEALCNWKGPSILTTTVRAFLSPQSEPSSYYSPSYAAIMIRIFQLS